MPDTPPTAHQSGLTLADARLALEDGTVYRGRSFGANAAPITQAAEVVFNTAMSGYQEALTDPSYSGQILVMTQPLIGNTGVNDEDVESSKVQVSGFVVRELARRYSNFRAATDLSTYLAKYGVLGISGIDTRALTRRLRVAGVMRGVISNDPGLSDEQLVTLARKAPDMAGQNLVPLVGCASASTWNETLGDWSPETGAHTSPAGRKLRVLALDCGAKRNILRNLAERGCEVTVVPHTISADEVRELHRAGKIDGVFISNGPGDPAAVENVVRTLRELVAGKPEDCPPTFGICLGHQLLGLALGAKTFKLKFGHRGSNQPVQNTITGKVEITSQNHGFAVDPASLKQITGARAEATHIHLNDGTLAGFRATDRPVFSVQYHPEASPGPHDAGYLFDAFVRMMETRKPLSEELLRETARAAG